MATDGERRMEERLANPPRVSKFFSGGLLPIAISGAAMAANGEQLLIEAARDPPRVDLVQSDGESEDGLAEGEVAVESGGFKVPGREEGRGGRLGTGRRSGSLGGGAAGVSPGVAGAIPGVAGSIPGVAGSIPGVAGSIPGRGSGETIMVQGFGLYVSGWEGGGSGGPSGPLG